VIPPIFYSINGVPSCANRQLLTTIAREEFGFKGYIVSDDLAIGFIKTAHKYTNDSTVSVALAVKAGCNMELAYPLNQHLFHLQKDALDRGRSRRLFPMLLVPYTMHCTQLQDC
jgi:beta-glucosidase